VIQLNSAFVPAMGAAGAPSAAGARAGFGSARAVGAFHGLPVVGLSPQLFHASRLRWSAASASVILLPHSPPSLIAIDRLLLRPAVAPAHGRCGARLSHAGLRGRHQQQTRDSCG
jgi:hypothetical protein